MATRYQQEVQRILSDPRRNSAGSGGTTNEDENDEEESEDDRSVSESIYIYWRFRKFTEGP